MAKDDMNLLKCLLRALVLTLLLLVPAGVLAQEPAQGGAAPGSVGSGQAPAANPPREFSPADIWAPLSRLHAGPFSVYSAEITGGYSNYPAAPGLTGSVLNPLAAARVAFLRASTSMGLAGRWKAGSFSLTYTPTLYQDTSKNFREASHNASLNYQTKLGRSWEFSLNGTGGNYSQYDTLLQSPPLARITQLQVPITNRDLMEMIAQPAVYMPPTATVALQAQQMIRASATASLTLRLGTRNRISWSAGYYLNRGMDGADNAALLLSTLRTRGASASVGMQRSLTPHFDLGFSVGEQRTGVRLGDYRQRQAQLTMSWQPARHWSVHVAAGPAMRSSANERNVITAAINASVARIVGSGLINVSYVKDLYMAGIVQGGSESRAVSLNWSPRKRGRHFVYSLGGGYVWTGGMIQSGRALQSWFAQPSCGIPITRSMQFFTQYMFFSQSWSLGAGSGSRDMQRHMVTMGLRFNFQRPGQGL